MIRIEETYFNIETIQDCIYSNGDLIVNGVKIPMSYEDAQKYIEQIAQLQDKASENIKYSDTIEVKIEQIVKVKIDRTHPILDEIDNDVELAEHLVDYRFTSVSPLVEEKAVKVDEIEALKWEVL